MKDNELYVYHIVTRKKMSLGQKIHFDKNQKNTLYSFFFEREQLNSKGEDFVQILQNHYTNEGLNLNKENADVVIKYADQTTRAIREVIVEWSDYKNFLSILQEYLVYTLQKAMVMY